MAPTAATAPPFFLESAGMGRTPGGTRSFADMLAPLEVHDFLDTYWELYPFHLARHQHDYFAGLLSSRQFDELVANTSRADELPLGSMQAARDKPEWRVYKHDDWSRDLCSLYSTYGQGATITLNHLERHSNPIGLLCRDMEGYFHRPVEASAILTPGNTQGFQVHFDMYDVIAFQLEGTKRWRIYERAMDYPLAGQSRYLSEDELSAPLHEVELQPGDVLYLPRGYPHEARANEQPSLHLIVGAESWNWLDLLGSALAQIGKRQADFRRALPPSLMRGDETDSKLVFRRLLSMLAEEGDFAAALRPLADRFYDSLRALPSGHLGDLGALGALSDSSRLRKRPGTICRVRETDDGVEIQFPGSRVQGPGSITAALWFVKETDEFALGDLPGLSEGSRLVLARRLLREGLLQLASDPR